MATAFATMMAMPAVTLAPHVTPVDDLVRLRAALESYIVNLKKTA